MYKVERRSTQEDHDIGAGEMPGVGWISFVACVTGMEDDDQNQQKSFSFNRLEDTQRDLQLQLVAKESMCFKSLQVICQSEEV